MNASNLYYKSLQRVQEELENKSFSKPVFVTISEDDSVIKAEEIVSIFSNNFKNPNSQLLWFGKKNSSTITESLLYHLIFQKNILVIFSHLSVLFKKNHFFYGKNGSYRMFKNGQDKIYNEKEDELWYLVWGLKEEGKYFARLTWNPYFDKTIKTYE